MIEMKINIVDNDTINNINMNMLMWLDFSNKRFGTEYVISDGRITEIHYKNRIVRGN